MGAGAILILAVVLFPVAVRVAVSIVDHIGSHQTAVTKRQ